MNSISKPGGQSFILLDMENIPDSSRSHTHKRFMFSPAVLCILMPFLSPSLFLLVSCYNWTSVDTINIHTTILSRIIMIWDISGALLSKSITGRCVCIHAIVMRVHESITSCHEELVMCAKNRAIN